MKKEKKGNGENGRSREEGRVDKRLKKRVEEAENKWKGKHKAQSFRNAKIIQIILLLNLLLS